MYRLVYTLPRPAKQAILLALDTALVPGALYFAFMLRYSGLYPWSAVELLPLFAVVTVAGAGVFYALGLHRIKLSAYDNRAIVQTALCGLALAVVAVLASYMLQLPAPRSVPAIFALLFVISSVSLKVLLQLYLYRAQHGDTVPKRILIYGAGQAGMQLIAAIRQTRNYVPVGFVDDSPALQGVIISGVPVWSAHDLAELVNTRRIDQIIVAMPSLSATRRGELLSWLKRFECDVLTLPSYGALLEGKRMVEDLQPVSTDDLLGRDKVDLDVPGVNEIYAGKSVLVTGAGGSIGSELCRQLATCGIRKLVLFEHSELALYQIQRELAPRFAAQGIELVSMLGSVNNRLRLETAVRQHAVEIMLHAAAYKHVPIVEENELAGLSNNVLGTRTAAEVAAAENLERFILVSTDKAVRPTNVMGATKRLAELVVQDFAARSKGTLFSMVRFGNVLGSSGSVIPLFKEQIARGGPVTVTHNDVTRYFMTISEAARLVLLACSFARGGDVFVLDMGEPVKIHDLARSMIERSGYAVRDADNPSGDIEIKVTGLRPGEKLYEELLIGDDMLTTPHPKILRAQEGKLTEIETAKAVSEIKTSIVGNDVGAARRIIETYVDGYHNPDHAGVAKEA